MFCYKSWIIPNTLALILNAIVVLLLPAHSIAQTGADGNAKRVSASMDAQWRESMKSSHIDTISYYLHRLDLDRLQPWMLEYPYDHPFTEGDALWEWLQKVRHADLRVMSLDTLAVWAHLAPWPETVIQQLKLLRFCQKSSPPKLSCQELLACGRHPPDIGQVGGEFDPADPCHRYHAFFITIQLMDRDSLKNDKKLMNKINKDPFLHFVLKYTGSFDSLRLIPSSLAADRIEAFLNLDEDTQCKVVLFRNSAFLRMRVFYIDWYRVLVPYSSRSRSVPESKCDSAWSILTSPVAKKFYNVCSMYTDTARYGSTGQSCQWLSRFPAILDSLREVRDR